MSGVDKYWDVEFPSDLLDEYSRIAHGHDNWTMDHDGHGNVIVTFWRKELEEDEDIHQNPDYWMTRAIENNDK